VASEKAMNWEGYLREVILEPERVKDFECYPYSIPAIRNLRRLPLHPKVTLFVGENGSGKSTLTEAIAILAGLNPEGGSRNFKYALRPSESSLFEALRLVRNPIRERSAFFLRAETMFNVSSEVESRGLFEYGWQDLHAKSHGEAFLWLVQNRFNSKGLYVLDEPEAALSPQRQLALLRLLYDLAESGAQFIVSTHSPILMAYPNAFLYELCSSGIKLTTLQETEHFSIMRSFLSHPQETLDELFRDAT
jgi:predicted ATPase